MTLPEACPRCGSLNTVYVAEAEVRCCREDNCGLDYWLTTDDRGRVDMMTLDSSGRSKRYPLSEQS